MADADGRAGGVLARWSERKLRARQDMDPPVTAAEDPPEAPVLTDADMPPVESLDDGSDYSGFLSPGVSEDLRRKALSKLFHAARFNFTDGLDDYAEDFTSFLPLGDIITVDIRHRMEQAAKDLLVDGVAETGDVVGEAPAPDEVADLTPATDSAAGDDGRTAGEPV